MCFRFKINSSVQIMNGVHVDTGFVSKRILEEDRFGSKTTYTVGVSMGMGCGTKLIEISEKDLVEAQLL